MQDFEEVNKSVIYMATVTKAIRYFNGSDNENVYSW